MVKLLRHLVLSSAVLLLSETADADNWPSWRGPSGNGLSSEKNLPVEWSPTKNVAWKLELPGPAGASPVVWGDRIFLTSVNDAGELLLVAIDYQWQAALAAGCWSRQPGVSR